MSTSALAIVSACVAALGVACASSAPRNGDAPSVVRAYAPVNGLSLYYELHGAPRDDAPPILLLHGGGSTLETSFARAIPLLAAHRRVIAFDQQGHGRTADVDRPFSFEQSADDALALLRHLRVERADVWGYSNGGSIALQLAIRHPEAVRKLVLESVMTSRAGTEPEFWKGFDHATIESMPKELKDEYRRVAPHPEALQSFFDKSVERMRTFRDLSPETLRSIEAPSLVVIGDRDVVRPEHAVETFRALKHAELCVLPGTDHMRIVESAEWLVPRIEAFLDAPTSR